MVDNELVEYIQRELQKGTDVSTIKQKLIDVGWTTEDLNAAFSEVGVSESETNISPSDTSPSFTNFSSDNHLVVNESSDQIFDKKTRRTKPLLILAVLLIFAIAASAVYGYFYVYLAPERVLARSMEKMEQVKSMSYTGSMNMKLTGDVFNQSGLETNPEYSAMSLFVPKDFVVTFDGQFDSSEPEKPKNNGVYSLTSNGVKLGEIEALIISDVSYFKLNQVNTFGFLDLNKYLDKWLIVDPQVINEKYGVDYEQEATPTITEEQKNEISKSLRENPPIEIIETLDDEEINGRPSFHYKYRVNKENLALFYEDIALILQNYPGMKDFNIDNFNKSLETINFYEGDIWIGKEDYYLYEFTLGLYTEAPEDDFKIDISFNFAFDKFNETLSIEPPSEFIDLEDLEKMIMEDYAEYLDVEVEDLQQLDSLETDDMDDLLQVLRPTSPAVSGLHKEI